MVHTLPYLHFYELFFFIFQKSDPDGRLPRKTAPSRGICAYLLPQLPCLGMFVQFPDQTEDCEDLKVGTRTQPERVRAGQAQLRISEELAEKT